MFLKSFLKSLVRDDDEIPFKQRNFHGIDNTNNYLWTNYVYFDTGSYEEPLYGTWRYVEHNRAILFPEDQSKTTELTDLVKKKLSKFEESQTETQKCTFCTVKNNYYKVMLDQEYASNDVFKFIPKAVEMPTEKWYSKYVGQYWPFKPTALHMIFENQSTISNSIEIVCTEEYDDDDADE